MVRRYSTKYPCYDATRGSSLIPQARLLFFGIRITIREANVSDTDIIAEFNSQMALETEQRRLNPERLRKGVAALLEDKAKGVYFLAEIENETNARTIAGQLMLTYEWSDWRNGNFWWIYSFFCLIDFRFVHDNKGRIFPGLKTTR